MPIVETFSVTGTVDNFSPTDLPVVLFEGDKEACLDFFERNIQSLIKDGYRTRRSKTDKTPAFVFKGRELRAILDISPDECKHPSDVTSEWIRKNMTNNEITATSLAKTLGVKRDTIYRHLSGGEISTYAKAAYFYFFKTIQQ